MGPLADRSIDRRWAVGGDARLPQFAQQLPIVMTGTADPVATGLVATHS
jgi:hypothetical protein